ncbi:cadherin-related family member 3-like isoform X2 [Aotus nancymaae]|uniref:cadherin-related family member 3-like isoform X2 n=1 Tax=Aotus nancymaae TaxID=37293 RepID=UPI0030FF04C2
MYTAINTYKSNDWYIPFIFTLMAIFLAGLISWLCFLLWKYGNIMECCQKMIKEVSKAKPNEMKYIAGDGNQKENIVTGNRNKKLEVLTETIVYETVFDGEAIDPGSLQWCSVGSLSGLVGHSGFIHKHDTLVGTFAVSGNVYEYNSRTGARKWKKSPRHQKEPLANIYSLPEVHPLEESTSLKIPLQG